jgi:hypothetical protein
MRIVFIDPLDKFGFVAIIKFHDKFNNHGRSYVIDFRIPVSNLFPFIFDVFPIKNRVNNGIETTGKVVKKKTKVNNCFCIGNS